MDLIERLEAASGYDFSGAVRDTLRYALDRDWITQAAYMQACEQCNVAAYLDAALTLIRDDAFVFSLEWDDEPVERPIWACVMHPAKPSGVEEHVTIGRPTDATRGGWKRELARATLITALRARQSQEAR